MFHIVYKNHVQTLQRQLNEHHCSYRTWLPYNAEHLQHRRQQHPIFSSVVWPETRLASSPDHSESHVPGRHLNALLNAEYSTGIWLDETAVENHRLATLLSFGGAVEFPLNRPTPDAKPTNFCAHNLREGFHALYALAAFRDDAKARELAERCITSIRRLWQPNEGWDLRQLKRLDLNYQECHSFIHGEGRMLGPLVKYYRATGYGPALELVMIMKEKTFATGFPADGQFDREALGTSHIHSVTCVTSSLAQLADLLGDAALMTRVKAMYDNGFWKLRDEIGWSPESLTQKDSDHGESNNSGDILETALILGRWGHTKCYHDTERILRCHLLPSQVRDVSFIEEMSRLSKIRPILTVSMACVMWQTDTSVPMDFQPPTAIYLPEKVGEIYLSIWISWEEQLAHCAKHTETSR